MKKMIALVAVFLLAAAMLGGCKPDTSAPAFTHGIYQVGYKTAVTRTDDGKPAVQVTYPYYVDGSKKVKGASAIARVVTRPRVVILSLALLGAAAAIVALRRQRARARKL